MGGTMANRIVGLDIGREVIRAIEVENADKVKPMILRFAQVAIPEGAVRSGEVREVNTVAAAVKRLWTEGGFKTKKVVLGIGNQRVIARDLAVPKAGYQQIRESLPFQVQDMLPVPVADALLDFYAISESESEQGPMINGLLVAAIKESVLANVTAVRQAGLLPVHVDLIPFALSRVLTRGNFETGTVVLIDVGASTTNVVVTTSGVPQFVRMIPVGGDDLTKALMSRMELSPQHAEAAKRTRGLTSAPVSSEAERKVAEIIHELTSDLLNSLRNTVTYYSNTHPADTIRAIVLSGGGAQMTGFAQALGDSTRLPVVFADPFAAVESSKSLAAKTPEEREGLTVALGLALGHAA